MWVCSSQLTQCWLLVVFNLSLYLSLSIYLSIYLALFHYLYSFWLTLVISCHLRLVGWIGWLGWVGLVGWVGWLVGWFGPSTIYLLSTLISHFPVFLPRLTSPSFTPSSDVFVAYTIPYNAIPYHTVHRNTTDDDVVVSSLFCPFFRHYGARTRCNLFFFVVFVYPDDCGWMNTLRVERCDVPSLTCNKQNEPWLIPSCTSRSYFILFPGGTPVRRSVPWTPNHPTKQKHRREGDAQEWTHQPDEELAQRRYPNQQNTSSPAIITIPCDGACYPGAAASPWWQVLLIFVPKRSITLVVIIYVFLGSLGYLRGSWKI